MQQGQAEPKELLKVPGGQEPLIIKDVSCSTTQEDGPGFITRTMNHLEEKYSPSTLGRAFAVVNALFQALLNFSSFQIKSSSDY